MANYYTHITQAGDTLTSIEDNGGTYNVGVSQDIDCSDVDCQDIDCRKVYNSTTSKLNYYDGAWKVVEIAS